MAEQTYRNVALRVAYDSADDTYDLEFPTWRRTMLDYTEAGRLLSGEGAHPTATRGILACAVDAAPDRVLVSFVPGSESFVSNPAVEPVEHDVTMPPVRDMAEVFPVLGYFSYAHLPTHLRLVSQPFFTLAHVVANQYADGADERELAKALDRLLEAKDAAVRAAVKP